MDRRRWPGNLRELANALERAAILAEGDELRAGDVWLEAEGGAGKPAFELKLLAEPEKDAILRALEVVGGNRRQAAELLGIGERTLHDRLKKYGVD